VIDYGLREFAVRDNAVRDNNGYILRSARKSELREAKNLREPQ
jgi:hypothetical protein